MSDRTCDDVWKTYTRGVKRVVKPPLTKIVTEPAKPKVKKIAVPQPPLIIGRVTKKVAVLPSVDISRPANRSEQRIIRKGEMVVESALDLHGMNQTRAHHELRLFLEYALARGQRRLLVVTGRGKGGGGVLRQKLQEWLLASTQGQHIRLVHKASPQHGGDGAFYVVLKSRRV